MRDSLYDHELDANPPSDAEPGGDAVRKVSGGGRGTIGEWFAGLSLPDVIGVGLWCGVLFSAPLFLAFPAGGWRSTALVIVQGLSVPIFLMMRPQIRGLSLRVKAGLAKGLPQARARLTAVVAGRKVLVGFLAGVVTSAALMPNTSPPPPAPVAAPRGPVAFAPPPPAPVVAAVAPTPRELLAGNMANVVIPSGPSVVPPLVEEPPEPNPGVSEEALKGLRDGLRKRPALRLEPIMDGVRRACGSEGWQRGGWRDYELEFALDELVYRVKRATERPGLELPVRFGELPAGVAESPKGVLSAVRGERLRSAVGSILLVDGDLDLGFARGCLILATGRVNVRQGQGNFIVAGDGIDVGDENTWYDGKEPEGVGLPSLWVSGTTITMSYGRRLICAAPRGIKAHSIRESALLNSPVRALNQVDACSEYTSKRLDFRLPPRAGVAVRDEPPAGAVRGMRSGAHPLGPGRPVPGTPVPRMPRNSQPVAATPLAPAPSLLNP